MESMKRKKSGGNEVALDESEYPYGLQISLQDEEVEKLGLEGCEAGQELYIKAKVKVSSVSEYANEEGEDRSEQDQPVASRTACVNLLEGSISQILELLDDLTYGDNVPAGLRATRDTWASQGIIARRRRSGEVRG